MLKAFFIFQVLKALKVPNEVNMKIVTFVNRKGGCGKTTLVCLLALHWAEKGKAVAIRDLDPQGTSAAFVDNIEHPRIFLYEEDADCDFILVDTLGGIQNKDLKPLVKISDLVLIPFGLSPTDMRATGQTGRLIDELGENLKARLIFNKVKTVTTVFRDRISYADLMGIKALKSYLVDRVSYKHALVHGQVSLNRKTKDELAKLAKEVERGLK